MKDNDLESGRDLLKSIQGNNHTNDMIEHSLIALLGVIIGGKILYYMMWERKQKAEELKRSHDRKSFKRLKRRFSESLRSVFKSKDSTNRQENGRESSRHKWKQTRTPMGSCQIKPAQYSLPLMQLPLNFQCRSLSKTNDTLFISYHVRPIYSMLASFSLCHIFPISLALTSQLSFFYHQSN